DSRHCSEVVNLIAQRPRGLEIHGRLSVTRARRPRQWRRARARLTRIPYFHKLQTTKTLARLPLSQLEAAPEHPEAFKALPHPSRLEVFFTLVRAKREMAVGEIQEKVGIPGPTLSHHLDLLRRAGLVETRKEERFIYYSVRRDTVSTLCRLLTACC